MLEPLYVYLMIAAAQYDNESVADWYNVGPNESDCLTTGELAGCFCDAWGGGQSYVAEHKDGPHEANFLKLDCSKVKSVFGWKPRWTARQAVEKTVEWTKAYADKEDMAEFTAKQIKEFFNI